ncbi:MAG: NUDIX domain-containing protein [Spirochaetia bacterium]|jgi:8-oxo-dGTP diphosphatase|nr:NUDIX domain-containing protein [Spirochaetia bacterium]
MIISTAGIAIKNSKFLLALRLPGTSIGESWEFPGGKAEKGETPSEALIREFKEELNVTVEVGERICSGEFRNKNKEFEIYGFLIELLSEKFILTEHSEVGWFALDEMASLKMAGSDNQIVQSLKYLYPPE